MYIYITERGGEPKVINLSSKKLSSAEIQLLSKGLKFTPTPKPNVTELESDITEFTRKLRLSEFFGSQDDNDSQTESDSDNSQDEDPSLVRNKSKFHPPHNRDKILESYIDYIQGQPLNSKNAKNNMRSDENAALQSLQNDNSIIIKEADKGGAVVIMDTDYYKSKIEVMLSDTEAYKQVTNSCNTEARSKVNSFAIKHLALDNITEKEEEFLTDFECVTSNFYGLPKIHKSKEIAEAIKSQQSEYIEVLRPTDLTFRPIVGGPQCQTHRLSNLLDIILKPLACKVDSYLRDSMDFLNKLPTQTESDSILVTYDVTSLYSVIPHNLGLEAVAYWYDRYKDALPRDVSKEMIIEGLEIVLKNNTLSLMAKYFFKREAQQWGQRWLPRMPPSSWAF